MLFHGNLPLLLGVCNNYKHPNIMVMSYHPFNGQTESQTVHAALKTTHLTKADWKQVLLGCASALAYLAKMKVLHNDIKTDNILVEYLAPEYKQCRSILVDFGKARYASEANFITCHKIKKKNINFAIHKWLQRCVMVFVSNPLLAIYILLGALCSTLMVNYKSLCLKIWLTSVLGCIKSVLLLSNC